MTQDELKQAAAQAALEEIQPGAIIGVGTGSTANHFIAALRDLWMRYAGQLDAYLTRARDPATAPSF